MIDESLDTYVRTIASGKRKKDKKSQKQFTRLTKKIKSAQQLALELGDQKVALSVQSYDLVRCTPLIISYVDTYKSARADCH